MNKQTKNVVVCGDIFQNTPVVAKVLKLSPDLIPWDYYLHISKTQENLQEEELH
jgi:hypothetical protein